MAQLFTDNAVATLASGITSGATSLTLATGKGALFPSPANGDYFVLTLTQAATETAWEKVKVTARSTDTLTIVRGFDGSSAAAWSTGDKAELRYTAIAAKAGAGLRWVGNVSAGGTSTGENSIKAITIPGGTLEVGDRIRIFALWKHTGGVTNSPRFAVKFGATYACQLLTAQAADDHVDLFADVVVTGATAQEAYGWIMRPNGTIVAPGAGTSPAEAISGDIVVDFHYRFDASGETVLLSGYSVEVVKNS